MSCRSVRLVGSLHPPDQAKANFQALLDALIAGDLKGTRAAASKCSHVVAYVSGLGETPVHAAIVQRDMAPLLVLLEAGANPNQRNGDKKPPLYTAVECGNVAAAKALLEYGAHPSMFWTNPTGRHDTALFLACIKGDVEMMQALIPWCVDSDVNHIVMEDGARQAATDSVVKLSTSKSIVVEFSHKAFAGRRLRESLARGAEEEKEEDPADEDEDSSSDMLFVDGGAAQRLPSTDSTSDNGGQTVSDLSPSCR